MRSPLFNRLIAIPQDHGSWVFILSPLLIGLFAGGSFHIDSIPVITAALAAFLIRQPIAIAVKIVSGRRPRTDYPGALFWMSIYAAILILSVVWLVVSGNWIITLLAVPALPIFGVHLYLVSRRAERKQAGLEIVATGILALAAPAAYWAGGGPHDLTGWMLWLLCWLQSAASIVHVYMRLEQRGLAGRVTRVMLWKLGRRAMIYTTFDLVVVSLFCLLDLLPAFLFFPYLIQSIETCWGIIRPAIGHKPVKIGLRQLLVSTLFTLLFILTWR
jgi:hypothetical protein